MRSLTFALFLAAGFALLTPLHSQTPTHVREQTTFSESDALARPVAVPPAVSNLILTDLAEHNVSYGGPQGKTADQLFAASEIHLGPANEIHLVLIGVCGPMCGADSSWLWIIRFPYKNPKIIGFASGGSFGFLTTKSHGYPDFGTSLTLASGIWTSDTLRFDGSEYKVWKRRKGQRHQD